MISQVQVCGIQLRSGKRAAGCTVNRKCGSTSKVWYRHVAHMGMAHTSYALAWPAHVSILAAACMHARTTSLAAEQMIKGLMFLFAAGQQTCMMLRMRLHTRRTHAPAHPVDEHTPTKQQARTHRDACISIT